MSTLPGKTVLVTGGLAANGYLTSVGPSGDSNDVDAAR